MSFSYWLCFSTCFSPKYENSEQLVAVENDDVTYSIMQIILEQK